jgi:DNA-3-methyladenine glycosylase II
MFTDKILCGLVLKYPPPAWTDRSEFLFEDLVGTVISQQISGSAAESIFKRFKAVFSTTLFPDPQSILETNELILRNTGLPQAKVNYIRNIATAFVKGDLEIPAIKEMDDEAVIEKLTQIKGIGRWSAEMILISTLNRPDVFSIGDLGLRHAIERLYGIKEKEKMVSFARRSWSPNRSTACWYLWRSLENTA